MTIKQRAYMMFVHKTAADSIAALDSSTDGLLKSEIAKRRSQYGFNTITSRHVSWLVIFVRQFKSPFIYLLIGAAALAYLLKEFVDGSLILLFVLINTLLGFFQEYRSEQALRILRRYTSKTSRVIRQGAEIQLKVDDLVPGDIVRLLPGDIVPADLRLISTADLLMDESVLTGESKPVVKSESSLHPPETPLYAIENMVFSTTTVVSGEAQGLVVATGNQSYIGGVAALATQTRQESSFERGMGSISQFVLRLVGVTLAMVFFANLMIKGDTSSVGDLVIFSIALATAVIPEALPLVTTFSLSRGAMRLAKHKVVVKRLSAIEDLGGIEVLCTDKTGTITENSLEVVETYGDDNNQVLRYATVSAGKLDQRKDPFDVALAKALKVGCLGNIKITHEIPFDPVRKRGSVLIREGGDEALLVRGAAEAILPHLTEQHLHAVKLWIVEQEKMGRRVIVVARKHWNVAGHYVMADEEHGLSLIGAISFADPLKKSTIGAVKKAQQLGIRLKIITGDSPVVSGAVGKEIGLIDNAEAVITAAQFFSENQARQLVLAQDYSVFARFSPDEKHRLVDILQTKYEVGFLGEGINDAPALKSANVALVVQSASDISREAADIILLNKSLHVVIDGIEEGRRVFANTIKYVKITLASNFGNFYAVAIASLIIDFLPMLPIQILLVNLLTDFPLIAIATDSVDAKEVSSPEGYNLREFALIATVIGLVSTVFDFIYFGLFYTISPSVLQTNWFIGSILTELALLYSLRTKLPFFRSKLPPSGIIGLTLAAAVVTIVLPYTSFGQTVFRFTAPSFSHLGLILGVAVSYFITTEIVKMFYYRFVGSQATSQQNRAAVAR